MAGVIDLAEACNLSQRAVTRLFEEIETACESGDVVVIKGFGTFYPELIPERVAVLTPVMRDRGDEPRTIPPLMKMRFRPTRTVRAEAKQSDAATVLINEGRVYKGHGGRLLTIEEIEARAK